ncbi:MAG: hormogonium polysaccharide secretion pseudopilin HpsC [Cyanobacteria bacterium P01_H01_bin.150]
MIPIRWLKRKSNKNYQSHKTAGFTLIELLVAMILASLILTPLLGFMINIMQTERREQAKTNTEQEIKSALDFIARDLEQAVYIYDADGIAAIRTQLPKSNSTEQKKFFPVLVFWKRQYLEKVIPIAKGAKCESEAQKKNCDDTYVYSLVAYYLIKDDNSTWSKAARIGRFQLSDGYGENKVDKDAGFKEFELKGIGDLKAKMNKWESDIYTTNTPDIVTLVDYIDQTKIDTVKKTNPRPAECPTGMQQIPDFARTIKDNNVVPTGDVETASFHVCVDSINTVAEVYLRGNALARIENTPPSYNKERKNYFPQARIRVEGRGFVFTK